MTQQDFPGRYPYRDYGLKYWDAIHAWVSDYLDVSSRDLTLVSWGGGISSFVVCALRAWHAA